MCDCDTVTPTLLQGCSTPPPPPHPPNPLTHFSFAHLFPSIPIQNSTNGYFEAFHFERCCNYFCLKTLVGIMSMSILYIIMHRYACTRHRDDNNNNNSTKIACISPFSPFNNFCQVKNRNVFGI